MKASRFYGSKATHGIGGKRVAAASRGDKGRVVALSASLRSVVRIKLFEGRQPANDAQVYTGARDIR